LLDENRIEYVGTDVAEAVTEALTYISIDYVFKSVNNDRMYTEERSDASKNECSRTKLAGEETVSVRCAVTILSVHYVKDSCSI